MIRQPLGKIQPRLSEALNGLVPHLAAAELSTHCAHSPFKTYGEQALAGRITPADLHPLVCTAPRAWSALRGKPVEVAGDQVPQGLCDGGVRRGDCTVPSSRSGSCSPADLARGHRNRVIAQELHISESTVKFHVANILTKLGVASRGEASALFHAVARRPGLRRSGPLSDPAATLAPMSERWALAAAEGDGARLVPLGPDGLPAGPLRYEPDLAEAVRSRPDVGRWVWRSTAEIYPRLLAAGVRVERCYDIEDAEQLLLGHEGRLGEPRSAAAAWARLHHAPVPPDPPQRAAEPGSQSSLFEPQPVAVPLESLLEVYAEQQRRHDAAEHPGRMRLLTAAESAGMLVAAEMNRAGLPWRADKHRDVLHELLGERYAGGGEPRRLAELADEVSAAFGRRVRPDLPADVVKAFAQAGIRVKSTRRWELEEIGHPAVKPLIQYKKLYRIWTAHGWSWLQDWVRDGRFRPEYLPGGTVSGRWTTNGGGALQIPKVIRRAVVADEGWRLVVADADQMEPRVLAAISRDPGLMEVAGHDGDLYSALSDRAFSGDRDHAKVALLGAIYGQTSGDGLKNLAMLRRRFPLAVSYVDEAARAGEEGRLVRTWLGRTSPRAAGSGEDEEAGIPQESDESPSTETEFTPGYASSNARARGRFTRNFVVQGSAADWALLMLAALRQATAGMRAELVFFQHDEVIVHCPAQEADAVANAIRAAGELAGRIAFGQTPVRFPFTTAVVECYADAK